MPNHKELNREQNWLCSLAGWIISSKPQGIGAILVGVAAIIASLKSETLLDKVLKIQESSMAIEIANEKILASHSKLVELSSNINLIVTNIQKTLKDKFIQKAVNSDQIKRAKSAKDVSKVLREMIEDENKSLNWHLYISDDAFSETSMGIYEAKSKEEKKTLLENSIIVQGMLNRKNN